LKINQSNSVATVCCNMVYMKVLDLLKGVHILQVSTTFIQQPSLPTSKQCTYQFPNYFSIYTILCYALKSFLSFEGNLFSITSGRKIGLKNINE